MNLNSYIYPTLLETKFVNLVVVFDILMVLATEKYLAAVLYAGSLWKPKKYKRTIVYEILVENLKYEIFVNYIFPEQDGFGIFFVSVVLI